MTDLNLINFDINYEMIDGIDAIIQEIKIALSLQRGTWFLDLNAGIDWINFLGRNPNLPLIRQDIRKEIEKIIDLKSFSVIYDRATESLKIKFSCEFEKEIFKVELNSKRTESADSLYFSSMLSSTSSIV